MSLVQDKVHARRGHHQPASPAHSTHIPECAGEASLCVQGGKRTLTLLQSPVLALVIVAAEGLAVDEGERGDDEDDAGRSAEERSVK